MKKIGWVVFLSASVCLAQEPASFRPAETNVWAAEYPRVDAAGRVAIRIKAPDATKVRVSFWSGPKLDLTKQPDGMWTVETPPLVPGLHYYTLTVDGGVLADPAAFAKKVRLLWLGVGTAEPERMRAGIRSLHASLTETGIAHVYQESEGTDHEWQTWRRNLEDFAPRLFR